jgi:hypothetical protein
MSGSKPSRFTGRKASSHSFGKIPLGNQRNKCLDGDNRPQPRAEFRGNDPWYTGFHGTYDPVFSAQDKNALNFSDQPYQARVPRLKFDTRTSGVVGPEIDWSVKARNLPIVFEKQFRDVGRHTHPKLRQVYDILFDDYLNNRKKFVEAKYRPNVGCVLTRFWSDKQVQTWTEFAHLYGVTFHGDMEYNFPRDIVGYKVGVGYHSSHMPWPKPGEQGPLKPFTFSHLSNRRKRKRSEFSRMLRKLKSSENKMCRITPLDLSSVLVTRRSKSSREIRRDARLKGVTFQQEAEATPLILTVNLGRHKPAAAPSIVVASLKSMVARPQKFIHDRSWISPTKLEYKTLIQRPLPSIIKRVKTGRLTPFFSRDGRIYAIRANLSNRHIFQNPSDRILMRNPPPLEEAERMEIALQNYIDSQADDNVPSVLGTWGDGWD